MNEKQIVLEDLEIRLEYAEDKIKELEDELNSWKNEKYSIIEQIEKLNEQAATPIFFCRRAADQVCAFSIIPQLPAFCQGFFAKFFYFYFSQNA